MPASWHGRRIRRGARFKGVNCTVENTAYKFGLRSLALAIILFVAMISTGMLETLNTIDWALIVAVNLLMAVFCIAGIYLWAKGWQRYQSVLKNPWALAWYLGCLTVVGSYVLFKKHE